MNFTQFVAKQFAFPRGFGGRIATFIMNCMNRKQYKAVFDNIAVTPEDVILDIGFGNGFMIKKLLKKQPRLVCGVEIATDMLDRVKKDNAVFVADGWLDLQLADVQQLPYPNNYFDNIYTVNTIYFWQNAPQCFSEIARTLKDNGAFYNVFYSKEWLDKLRYTRYGFSKNNMEDMLEMTTDCGLKIDRVIEISKGKAYCIVGKKQTEFSER